MTIQQVCTFHLNGFYFGLEIENVQELIRQPPLTRIPLSPPDVCGLINLRGQVIPVVDLACRLGLRSAACGIGEPTTYNIVVHTIEDMVSFIVDDIGDVLHCENEEFEPPPTHLHSSIRSFLKGAYKLEQGFLLVLDTSKVLGSTPIANSLN